MATEADITMPLNDSFNTIYLTVTKFKWDRLFKSALEATVILLCSWNSEMQNPNTSFVLDTVRGIMEKLKETYTYTGVWFKDVLKCK